MSETPPTFPRETNEHHAFTVALDKVAITVTTGLEVAVFPDSSERPSPLPWGPSILHNGRIGFNIANLAPGAYRVFARPTDGPYRPVIDCGYFRID